METVIIETHKRTNFWLLFSLQGGLHHATKQNFSLEQGCSNGLAVKPTSMTVLLEIKYDILWILGVLNKKTTILSSSLWSLQQQGKAIHEFNGTDKPAFQRISACIRARKDSIYEGLFRGKSFVFTIYQHRVGAYQIANEKLYRITDYNLNIYIYIISDAIIDVLKKKRKNHV